VVLRRCLHALAPSRVSRGSARRSYISRVPLLVMNPTATRLPLRGDLGDCVAAALISHQGGVARKCVASEQGRHYFFNYSAAPCDAGTLRAGRAVQPMCLTVAKP